MPKREIIALNVGAFTLGMIAGALLCLFALKTLNLLLPEGDPLRVNKPLEFGPLTIVVLGGWTVDQVVRQDGGVLTLWKWNYSWIGKQRGALPEAMVNVFFGYTDRLKNSTLYKSFRQLPHSTRQIDGVDVEVYQGDLKGSIATMFPQYASQEGKAGLYLFSGKDVYIYFTCLPENLRNIELMIESIRWNK